MNTFQQLNNKLISSFDERDKLGAIIGIWACWGGMPSVLFFAVLVLIHGLYLPGYLWLTWAMILIIVPIINIRSRQLLPWVTTLHLSILLALPFVVDYLLGGFSRLGYAGFVIMNIAAAAIFERERIIFWTVLSSLAFLASILIEPSLSIDPRLPQWVAQAWTGGSTIVSLWVAALIISYFIRQRDRTLELLAAEKEKLRQMATIDPLTGAHNRRYFFEEGEKVHQSSLCYQHPYSVLMLDLDNFKRVNDTYGHAAGDEVLRETVRRMQSCIRNVDILGRYGGEEFTVLFPETDLVKAEQAAERLLDTLRSTPINVGPAELTFTASIGVAQSDPASAETFMQLVERADRASYHAKELGKNCVVKAE
jgi:diguanylate cyclase (GGDEF)-like protein